MAHQARRDDQGRRVFLPEPPPARVPTARILAMGILAWAIVLAVTTWGGWPGHPDIAPAVCIAGIVIGLVGLLWARTRRGAAPTPASAT